jgi:hypothetical protein
VLQISISSSVEASAVCSVASVLLESALPHPDNIDITITDASVALISFFAYLFFIPFHLVLSFGNSILSAPISFEIWAF